MYSTFGLRSCGLNGLGSPSGIETTQGGVAADPLVQRLNGLGSPSGIETQLEAGLPIITSAAKWPGEPVRD